MNQPTPSSTPPPALNASERDRLAEVSPKARPPRVVVAIMCSLLTGGLALLIWTKLRLVTGVPRTAYADPEHIMPPPHSEAPADETSRRDASMTQQRSAAPDGD